MPRSLYAHLLLFIANFIYAINFSIAKLVMPLYLKPFGFILLRGLAGTFLFWLASVFIKNHTKINKRDWPRIIACSIFGITCNQLCFFKGLSLTSPINASLIMTATPVIVLLFSALLLREKIGSIKIIGIALGLIGASYLIYGSSLSTIKESNLEGDIYVFINATSYGLFLVLVKPLVKKYNPILLMRWIFLFGTLFMIPFSLNDILEVKNWEFPTNIWLSIAFVLIGATFLAYLFNSLANRTLNPTIVSVYVYVQTLLASLIAIIWGGSIFTIEKLICFILICTGVFLCSWNFKFKPNNGHLT